MKKITLTAVLSLLLAVSACSKKQVTRIDPSEVTDLSGTWNDTDSRLVSEEMILDCLNHPWLNQHLTRSSGDQPVVIVGSIRNKSMEHIAVQTFVSDIERAFINSARVKVVATAAEREELRAERGDQSEFASAETFKQWGKELGADYMMAGYISSIEDQEEGEKVVYYQVDLTLTSIEDNSKVWLGQKKIKKYIARGKYKG